MNKLIKRLLQTAVTWLVAKYKKTSVDLIRIEVARRALSAMDRARLVMVLVAAGIAAAGVMSAGIILLILAASHFLLLALGWPADWAHVTLVGGLICFLVPVTGIWWVYRSSIWVDVLHSCPWIGPVIRDVLAEGKGGHRR